MPWFAIVEDERHLYHQTHFAFEGPPFQMYTWLKSTTVQTAHKSIQYTEIHVLRYGSIAGPIQTSVTFEVYPPFVKT
jgi:hypothetical protein